MNLSEIIHNWLRKPRAAYRLGARHSPISPWGGYLNHAIDTLPSRTQRLSARAGMIGAATTGTAAALLMNNNKSPRITFDGPKNSPQMTPADIEAERKIMEQMHMSKQNSDKLVQHLVQMQKKANEAELYRKAEKQAAAYTKINDAVQKQLQKSANPQTAVADAIRGAVGGAGNALRTGAGDVAHAARGIRDLVERNPGSSLAVGGTGAAALAAAASGAAGGAHNRQLKDLATPPEFSMNENRALTMRSSNLPPELSDGNGGFAGKPKTSPPYTYPQEPHEADNGPVDQRSEWEKNIPEWMTPGVIGGAGVGALAGGLLAPDATDENGNKQRSTVNTIVSSLLGAGAGGLAGHYGQQLLKTSHVKQASPPRGTPPQKSERGSFYNDGSNPSPAELARRKQEAAAKAPKNPGNQGGSWYNDKSKAPAQPSGYEDLNKGIRPGSFQNYQRDSLGGVAGAPKWFPGYDTPPDIGDVPMANGFNRGSAPLDEIPEGFSAQNLDAYRPDHSYTGSRGFNMGITQDDRYSDNVGSPREPISLRPTDDVMRTVSSPSYGPRSTPEDYENVLNEPTAPALVAGGSSAPDKSWMDNVGQYAQDNPWALAGAGLGGLAGGLFAPDEEDENGKKKRSLANTLMMGAAGAGLGGLAGHFGPKLYDQFTQPGAALGPAVPPIQTNAATGA